jgi:hypothetical protein
MQYEIWRDIPNYEGLYQASNLGRIRSLPREWEQKHYSGINSHYNKESQIMKLCEYNKNGYLYISLTKNKKAKKHLVHRLIAETFLIRRNNENYINHLDCDKKNNKLDNLEWCTQSHNIQYAYDNNTKIPPHMRKIKRFDLKNNYIDEFISLQEAERKTKIKASNISKCCRGQRNQAGGYKWQYAE